MVLYTTVYLIVRYDMYLWTCRTHSKLCLYKSLAMGVLIYYEIQLSMVLDCSEANVGANENHELSNYTGNLI